VGGRVGGGGAVFASSLDVKPNSCFPSSDPLLFSQFHDLKHNLVLLERGKADIIPHYLRVAFLRNYCFIDTADCAAVASSKRLELGTVEAKYAELLLCGW
jgi:hypothetical protein